MSTTVAVTEKPLSAKVAEWGPVVVSVVVLAIFLAAIVVAWQTKDPSLAILLGMAGANAGTAVGFWLGSSKGSQDKTAAMSTSNSPPPGSTVVTETPATKTTVFAPPASA